MAELRPHIIDGIEEYDNPLPRWWLYLFYFTIAFAIVYAVMYPSLWFWGGTTHWTSANQYTAWEASLPKPDPASGPVVDLEELSKDPSRVAAGKEIFKTYCTVCHGDNAEGKIGPPLVPHQWRYGSTYKDILTTIRGGRPKGMPVWSKALPDDKIQTVAVYVWTLSRGKSAPEPGMSGAPAPVASGAPTTASPAPAASGAPAPAASGAPAAAPSADPAAAASAAPVPGAGSPAPSTPDASGQSGVPK